MKQTLTINGITAEIELTTEQEKLFFWKEEMIWYYDDNGELDWFVTDKLLKDEILNHVFRHCFGAYSKEECIERKKSADMIEEYREHAEKCNGDKLDWENEHQAKFAVIYNSVNKVIHINSDHVIKYQGVIYFKRCGDIETFITKVGKDNFIKYVLGVRE